MNAFEMLGYFESKYPSLFRNNSPRYGFSPEEGWKDILDKLFSELVKSKKDFVLSQVKEKFGLLRVYIDPISDDETDLSEEQSIIYEYEVLSSKVCGNCGQQREEKVTFNHNGWIKSLCSECRKKDDK